MWNGKVEWNPKKNEVFTIKQKLIQQMGPEHQA